MVPYLIWMALFIVIPLLLVVYYAFTVTTPEGTTWSVALLGTGLNKHLNLPPIGLSGGHDHGWQRIFPQECNNVTLCGSHVDELLA